MTVQDAAADVGTFIESWQEWHSRQEAGVAAPHGFLAVTSLRWLQSAPERFDDAPGEWSTGPDGVRVVLAEGEELVVDGVAVHGEYRFGIIGERDSLYPASGDAVIEVAKRGGHDILRPRHPDNSLRAAYTGTPRPMSRIHAGRSAVATCPSTNPVPPRSGPRSKACGTSMTRPAESSSN